MLSFQPQNWAAGCVQVCKSQASHHSLTKTKHTLFFPHPAVPKKLKKKQAGKGDCQKLHSTGYKTHFFVCSKQTATYLSVQNLAQGLGLVGREGDVHWEGNKPESRITGRDLRERNSGLPCDKVISNCYVVLLRQHKY